MKWDSKSTKIKYFSLRDFFKLEYYSGNFVYILFENNEIIYIGQSKQILLRIRSHASNKIFDKIALKQISGKNNFIEAYLIFKFIPPLNASIPKNERFLCINDIWITDNTHHSKLIEVKIIGHIMYFDTKNHRDLKIYQKKPIKPFDYEANRKLETSMWRFQQERGY